MNCSFSKRICRSFFGHPQPDGITAQTIHLSEKNIMNEVTIKGEVKFVDEVREYGANGFRKQEVVVETLSLIHI